MSKDNKNKNNNNEKETKKSTWNHFSSNFAPLAIPQCIKI